MKIIEIKCMDIILLDIIIVHLWAALRGRFVIIIELLNWEICQNLSIWNLEQEADQKFERQKQMLILWNKNLVQPLQRAIVDPRDGHYSVLESTSSLPTQLECYITSKHATTTTTSTTITTTTTTSGIRTLMSHQLFYVQTLSSEPGTRYCLKCTGMWKV